jgi:hypothetical protein
MGCVWVGGGLGSVPGAGMGHRLAALDGRDIAASRCDIERSVGQLCKGRGGRMCCRVWKGEAASGTGDIKPHSGEGSCDVRRRPALQSFRC